MSDRPFSVYSGKFNCQKCNELVHKARLWKDTADVTWQCSKKHISKVCLLPKKKTKKDYEREERE
jgi:uncharacterized protein YjaG (DUF416 family)